MQEEVFDQNDGAADESGAKKKRGGVLYFISASTVEGRLLVHAGLATETEINSMDYGRSGDAAPMSAWNSHPICTNSWICLCLSNDDEHVCCHAALLCLWLQPTKAIGLHDGARTKISNADRLL